MMTAHTIAVVIAGGVTLGVIVWILSKIGKALIQIAEMLAAAALVFATVWLLIRALVWAIRQAMTHWRTSLTVMAILVWWHGWGAQSLALTVGVVTLGLSVWRLVDLVSFDPWVGRHLRAWWLRWTLYAPKLPRWLHASAG
jgi:DNA segregation ATPase FtsK/SpoIIIE, S-DNA-T family